jgi:hypothetical protein
MVKVDPSKIQDFLQEGLVKKSLSKEDLRVLDGWKPSTLISYHTAVRKLNQFMRFCGHTSYKLPITANNIYGFVAWARRGKDDFEREKITAASLTRYLFAIKAWHTFHNKAYPYNSKTRDKLMLKASGKSDALIPTKTEKAPVLLQDLAKVVRWLAPRGSEANAVADLAIIAFWGMAWMAELTYSSPYGPFKLKQGVVPADIRIHPKATLIALHDAKTAKTSGEVQYLQLQPMQSYLCPTRAVQRCLQDTMTPSDSFFGFSTPKGRMNLTKRQVNALLAMAWAVIGKEGLTGHSFCIGGATLRHAIGIWIDDIKSLVWWTTDCYKRYTKEISQAEIDKVLQILRSEMPLPRYSIHTLP